MAAGLPTGHIRPRHLSVYASRHHFRSRTLIDTLQHSILGARLTLTQAGITPASQTDLANPHVHHIVIRCNWGSPGVSLSITTRSHGTVLFSAPFGCLNAYAMAEQVINKYQCLPWTANTINQCQQEAGRGTRK